MDKACPEVNCYSSFTYAERPKSFRWEGKVYRVQGVVKLWQEPMERCFQVRTEDNKLFILCYNERKGKWSLVELVSN